MWLSVALRLASPASLCFCLQPCLWMFAAKQAHVSRWWERPQSCGISLQRNMFHLWKPANLSNRKGITEKLSSDLVQG